MTTVDLILPADYPLASMNTVLDHVCKQRETQPEPFYQFLSAWHAVSLRFLSCTEHHEAFTNSILADGVSPLPRSRYEQERELFGFFYTGLSVLECFYYGVYAIGHLARPDKFPFSKEEEDGHRKAATPHKTVLKWSENFGGFDLADQLAIIYNSDEFKHWKDVKNILTHRTAPGRHFGIRLGHDPPERETTLWFQGLVINADTTTKPYQWLADSLNHLASAAEITVPLILP